MRMKAFLAYVDHLRSLAQHATDPTIVPSRDHVVAALDGGAGLELRRLVPLKDLRDVGAFFTGFKLATKLLEGQNSAVRFLDPACGAGDLLLAAARSLPVRSSLHDTLRLWGEHLAGFDVHKEFVDAAKLRLLLLAQQRLGVVECAGAQELDGLFPDIVCTDALAETGAFRCAGCILMNPPYTSRQALNGCGWASGLVTSASLFMAHALEHAAEGSTIRAILPEVLRTGSRYSKWRSFVERNAAIEHVQPCGVFDDRTDVDVFVLRLCVRRSLEHGLCKAKWFVAVKPSGAVGTVGDRFTVRVGPVVPFRDPEDGPIVPYITPTAAPRWQTIGVPETRRRYSGRTFKPPFVVVRRTSRPGDKARATATIVTGSEPVAVENHLLVCSPRDGALSSCRKLRDVLQSSATSRWLDRRIRCRHLTVGSLVQVPWVEV